MLFLVVLGFLLAVIAHYKIFLLKTFMLDSFDALLKMQAPKEAETDMISKLPETKKRQLDPNVLKSFYDLNEKGLDELRVQLHDALRNDPLLESTCNGPIYNRASSLQTMLLEASDKTHDLICGTILRLRKQQGEPPRQEELKDMSNIRPIEAKESHEESQDQVPSKSETDAVPQTPVVSAKKAPKTKKVVRSELVVS